MGGKELFYIPAFIIVSDKDRHHNAAENENHVHIGVLPDIFYRIEGLFGGYHLPYIRIHRLNAGFSHARGTQYHCGNNCGNDEKNIEHGRMEQAVKINAEHTFQAFEKARFFKRKCFCVFHIRRSPFCS